MVLINSSSPVRRDWSSCIYHHSCSSFVCYVFLYSISVMSKSVMVLCCTAPVNNLKHICII
uniref:Uncharacterized protein n=1 Tax=Anguilla anguilla TaxID=7936 RepID=A0A0E9TAN8_ANGAN